MKFAVAVFALLSLAFCSPLRAAPKDEVEGQVIRYELVPDVVRKTVKKEMGNDTVKRVVKFAYPKQNVYRVELEGKKKDRILRVAADGELIRQQVAVDETKEKMSLNELPKAVRQSLEKEAGKNELDDIYKVTTEKDATWYIGEVKDGNGIRKVWLDEKGRVQKVKDYDPKGRVEKIRCTLAECPQAVQDTIKKESAGKDIKDIYEITRHSGRHFTVEVQDKGKTHTFSVGPKGYLLPDSE